MSFTKVAPAGIGTEPGTSIRLGDSLLHSTGLDIGTGSGIGVTIRQHGDATFTGIVTAASFSGDITGKATELATNATGTNLTLSGNLGVGGVITYEDVTNIDSVGVITARDGLRVTGIATATAFHGDGSQLTGIAPGSPVGGASTNTVFFENDNSVDVSYTISTDKNAMAAGPIAIKAGVTVTVPSGSFLTIV